MFGMVYLYHIQTLLLMVKKASRVCQTHHSFTNEIVHIIVTKQHVLLTAHYNVPQSMHSSYSVCRHLGTNECILTAVLLLSQDQV